MQAAAAAPTYQAHTQVPATRRRQRSRPHICPPGHLPQPKTAIADIFIIIIIIIIIDIF